MALSAKFALPFTYVAHLLGLAAAVMVLVWCIHFLGGLAFEATNKNLIFNQNVMAMPLHTNSRWIVDENDKRVKLACVNWPSHLEPVFAEGLSKQPLDVISKKIKLMGFNCVRLTWPLSLVTNDSLASLTVRQSFKGLGISRFIPGIQANNPSLLDISLIQAFQAVVANLGDNNVMVMLDNHISKQGWCCSETDEQGFFGDRYFDPELWLKGLGKMAAMFNGTNNVVAMSLRNELRGPRQNVKDWYRYMQKGAEAVHSENSNVLVILSGLEFSANLSFLEDKPVILTFANKLVFEVHWYSFFDSWNKNNANELCGNVVKKLMDKVGFVLEQGYPLVLSEFGLDLDSNDVYEGRYINCLLGVVAELDLEWAFWSLQGSYYTREGTTDAIEHYGVLSFNWTAIRNPRFIRKIDSIRYPFQGVGVPETRNVIYHPSRGLCILNWNGSLKLGSCNESKSWIYTPERSIKLNKTNSCLQAVGSGQSPVLGTECSSPSSTWDRISDSKMHFSSKTTDGTATCLDVDDKGVIVTNGCKCLHGGSACNPASQWFIITGSRRNLLS